MVRLPETLVTNADSPKPISRTLWQNSESPFSAQTRPDARVGSWHKGNGVVGNLEGESFIDGSILTCIAGPHVAQIAQNASFPAEASAHCLIGCAQVLDRHDLSRSYQRFTRQRYDYPSFLGPVKSRCTTQTPEYWLKYLNLHVVGIDKYRFRLIVARSIETLDSDIPNRLGNPCPFKSSSSRHGPFDTSSRLPDPLGEGEYCRSNRRPTDLRFRRHRVCGPHRRPRKALADPTLNPAARGRIFLGVI